MPGRNASLYGRMSRPATTVVSLRRQGRMRMNPPPDKPSIRTLKTCPYKDITQTFLLSVVNLTFAGF